MDELDDLNLATRDGDGPPGGAPTWDGGEPNPTGDHELSSPHGEPPRHPAEQHLSGQPKRAWLLSLLGLLVAALVGWWWWTHREQPIEAPAAPLATAPPEAAQPPPAVIEEEPPFVIPELSASDEVVATLVRGLSGHPRLVAWTVNDDLARRFVASVANLAEGASPKSHLEFLDPGDSFKVRRSAGAPTIDERSYRRYDLATEVFTSLDTAGSAALYGKLRPLFEEAWAELGMPSRSFDEVMESAFRRLLATPVLEGEVALSPRVTSFEFADPELENLAPAQKQLLRMGPRNVERIKAKLRELASAIGLDV